MIAKYDSEIQRVSESCLKLGEDEGKTSQEVKELTVRVDKVTDMVKLDDLYVDVKKLQDQMLASQEQSEKLVKEVQAVADDVAKL